jgi:hypothetical protein
VAAAVFAKQLTQFRRVIVYRNEFSLLALSFELKLETNFPSSHNNDEGRKKRASRVLIGENFSYYSNFKICSKQKLSVSGLKEDFLNFN